MGRKPKTFKAFGIKTRYTGETINACRDWQHVQWFATAEERDVALAKLRADERRTKYWKYARKHRPTKLTSRDDVSNEVKNAEIGQQ